MNFCCTEGYRLQFSGGCVHDGRRVNPTGSKRQRTQAHHTNAHYLSTVHMHVVQPAVVLWLVATLAQIEYRVIEYRIPIWFRSLHHPGRLRPMGLQEFDILLPPLSPVVFMRNLQTTQTLCVRQKEPELVAETREKQAEGNRRLVCTHMFSHVHVARCTAPHDTRLVDHG
ncbi:unnamed protein product [Ectocarpus sp. 12 AP-2014]